MRNKATSRRVASLSQLSGVKFPALPEPTISFDRRLDGERTNLENLWNALALLRKDSRETAKLVDQSEDRDGFGKALMGLYETLVATREHYKAAVKLAEILELRALCVMAMIAVRPDSKARRRNRRPAA
jgi:hypothetical protein